MNELAIASINTCPCVSMRSDHGPIFDPFSRGAFRFTGGSLTNFPTSRNDRMF